MNKKEFRKHMSDLNMKLSLDDKALKDELIYKNVIGLCAYRCAKCAFVYISVGDEVSTAKLISKMFSEGKRVCVPLCHGKGIMDAVEIRSEKDLVPGRYNIPEPSDKTRIVSPEELDLIIVPGVAFGEDGMRLGRGAGYYDRFLKRATNAKKVALCRELNIAETVPHEEHDESVDILVSELRIKEI